MTNHADTPPDNRAIVIGAGLGGLSAAMRLGAKGYAVTVLDRLDRVGGRGSSISQDGHRFDLGPTIVTVPQVFEDLWSACGRDFHKDIDLRPLEPFYEVRWPDGSSFNAYSDTDKMIAKFAQLRADKSIYKLAASRVKDDRLRMALSFHPLFIGGDPSHVTSIYALVAYLEKEFGVHYAMGGVQAIADGMASVIRAALYRPAARHLHARQAV